MLSYFKNTVNNSEMSRILRYFKNPTCVGPNIFFPFKMYEIDARFEQKILSLMFVISLISSIVAISRLLVSACQNN